MPKTDKLDGEFRVPLDMGRGSQATRFIKCPHCGTIKYIKKICRYMICLECNNGFDPKNEPDVEGMSTTNIPHIRGEQSLNYLKYRKKSRIMSDMYTEGKSRKTMGSTRYWREVNKRLNTKSKF